MGWKSIMNNLILFDKFLVLICSNVHFNAGKYVVLKRIVARLMYAILSVSNTQGSRNQTIPLLSLICGTWTQRYNTEGPTDQCLTLWQASPVRRVVSRFKMADCLQSRTILRMPRGLCKWDQRPLCKTDEHAQRSLHATTRASIIGAADQIPPYRPGQYRCWYMARDITNTIFSMVVPI